MAGKTSLTEAKPIRTREKEEEEVRGVGIHYMGKKSLLFFLVFYAFFFKKKPYPRCQSRGPPGPSLLINTKRCSTN